MITHPCPNINRDIVKLVVHIYIPTYILPRKKGSDICMKYRKHMMMHTDSLIVTCRVNDNVLFSCSIFRLYDAGIFVRLKDYYFGFLEESDCDPFIQTHSSTLGLDRLWPVFFVGGVGLAGATVVLMMEKLYIKPQELTLTK